MDYLDAVAQACDKLTTDPDPAIVSAALELAILAWKTLNPPGDPGWDFFGLELLAVADALTPQPQVVVTADPPHADGPQVRAAVRRLITALDERLELVAADEQLDLPARLHHSAAAARLRHALTALP